MPDALQPIRLATLPAAFDDDNFLFEVKYDGFRALAVVNRAAGATLLSRNGNVYQSFSRLSNAIEAVFQGHDAILDGEIVHFGADGRPMFFDLMRRRLPEHFCAFDLLALDGRDLRRQPLLERKHLLNGLIPPQPCAVVYVDTSKGMAGYCWSIVADSISRA